MKYLILGATGYIGGSVARRLVEDGHDVVGLARSPRAERDLRARGCSALRAQLSETRELARAAARVDGVVALSREAEGVAPNLPAVSHALVGALAGSRKPLLFTSGASIYAVNGDVLFHEGGARLGLWWPGPSSRSGRSSPARSGTSARSSCVRASRTAGPAAASCST